MSFFHAILSEGGLRVVDVEDTDPVDVAFDIEFFELVFQLPITREVELSDGTFITSTITWLEGTYDPNTPDDYTIFGTLELPGNVRNPGNVQASVVVTVHAVLTPDLLANKILWLRENTDVTSGNIDNWHNDFNRSLDAVKITDARRPNLNATGIEGSLPTVDFTKANLDTLRTEGTTIGLSGDLTYYVIFKCTDPTSATAQIIFENTDNGAAFVNTGIQAVVVSSEIRVDFRKNVAGAGNQQRIAFPYTSTGWSLLHIKHDSAGAGASINVVKLDGALIKKEVSKEPIVHNSNPLKIGADGITGATPFGGSMAEQVLTSDYHDAITESGLLDYIKTRYPTELSDIEFFDETRFRALDSVSEAWNGLDFILRGDGKYDFVAGTLTGKIYHLEQGATINDWTTTLLTDTSREIQKLKVFGRDTSGRLILISNHKDSAANNDDIGKIMLHRADTTADDGAYSSVDLITARGFPQGILVYDVDGDGEDEFLYAYEGKLATQGGIRWWKCSDIDDVLDTGNWTEHNAKTHEGAWWIAGFYNIGGTDRLVFGARNNTARNPAEIPGIYYLTPASPVTNTWIETTIDNTVADFLHVDVGNFFGNDVDIIAQNFDNGNIFGYNSASAWAKSTLISGGSGAGMNIRIIPNNTINGRSSFISFTENDWAYHNYYNGATWSRRKLFQTLGHPADNEILFLDVDDSGFMTIVFDDNTNLANANVRMFRL